MDMENMVYIHNETLFSYKNDEIFPFVTTLMDIEGNMLREVSQRRQIPYDFTYKWNLKNKINKQNSNKLIENILTIAWWEGMGEWVEKGTGLSSTNCSTYNSIYKDYNFFVYSPVNAAKL